MNTAAEAGAGSAAGASGTAGASSAAASAPGPAAASAAAAPLAASAPFEQTLAQLETLVAQLESGDLPLDVALRTFEQGVHLTRECQAALSAAQQKVQLLLQRGETTVLEQFDAASIERVSITTTGVTASSAAGGTLIDSEF